MGAVIRLKYVASRLRDDSASDIFRHVLMRLTQRAGDMLSLGELTFPLRVEDIADPDTLRTQHSDPVNHGILHIGWVCTPPGPGSGGHTTLFRVVEGLERRGHRCTLFLYDVNSDDIGRHEEVIRRCWPGMKAEVRSATPQITGVDAVVASSWATAHVVASRTGGRVHRFYFIQDYEPFFYPRGTLYTLAEMSYHLGLIPVALGEMVAGQLRQESGVTASCTVPFGCDTEVYKVLETSETERPRSGIVFYAKKNADRRGYLLGKLALERFHQVHPEQEIHVYGDRVSNWRIPVTNHGNLPPTELNKLYNRTAAGLVMSFTNISLAAEELLAAGNIPVLNDSPLARADLPGTCAVWARPTPAGMAAALSAVVESPATLTGSTPQAEVRTGWGDTQLRTADFIESVCRRSHTRV